MCAYRPICLLLPKACLLPPSHLGDAAQGGEGVEEAHVHVPITQGVGAVVEGRLHKGVHGRHEIVGFRW